MCISWGNLSWFCCTCHSKYPFLAPASSSKPYAQALLRIPTVTNNESTSLGTCSHGSSFYMVARKMDKWAQWSSFPTMALRTAPSKQLYGSYTLTTCMFLRLTANWKYSQSKHRVDDRSPKRFGQSFAIVIVFATGSFYSFVQIRNLPHCRWWNCHLTDCPIRSMKWHLGRFLFRLILTGSGFF